ncbi:hypothetical protein OUZ56_023363 [Daphnia magna]|uniref:Uncharacterized protein n=1 Tax=Daphnia magna TaxID=35525 RepID=A0ABR0AZ04_9CRUS|nr:hypothetical protein OUZ56_023363 [Daphnia magna]
MVEKNFVIHLLDIEFEPLLLFLVQQCGANIWEWEESAVEGKLYESSMAYEKRLFSVAGSVSKLNFHTGIAKPIFYNFSKCLSLLVA